MQTPTDPKGNSLIFLSCALESRDHAERLFKMFMRRKGISEDIDAMQAGVHALRDSVSADVRALESRDHAERLFKMFMRRKGISKDIDAMQAGVHALRDSVSADVRALRDRGQLLFFFTGTTVLQQAAGGAA